MSKTSRRRHASSRRVASRQRAWRRWRVGGLGHSPKIFRISRHPRSCVYPDFFTTDSTDNHRFEQDIKHMYLLWDGAQHLVPNVLARATNGTPLCGYYRFAALRLVVFIKARKQGIKKQSHLLSDLNHSTEPESLQIPQPFNLPVTPSIHPDFAPL